MADPTGRDNAETAGSLPPGVGYVDAPVIRRKAVAMLAALGCSILEFRAATRRLPMNTAAWPLRYSVGRQ
jgi:hypothetical protein